MRPDAVFRQCQKRGVSIHAPREGCDTALKFGSQPAFGFNSRTPGGVRRCLMIGRIRSPGFNSRTPGGVRRKPRAQRKNKVDGFNSRTPGGVRLHVLLVYADSQEVSIHAPREGCDTNGMPRQSVLLQVSIHAPREGCDLSPSLSTTFASSFNSRTPGGVRHGELKCRRPCRGVSIHAPREGCDYGEGGGLFAYLKFQFTHPGRGATPP